MKLRRFQRHPSDNQENERNRQVQERNRLEKNKGKAGQKQTDRRMKKNRYLLNPAVLLNPLFKHPLATAACCKTNGCLALLVSGRSDTLVASILCTVCYGEFL
jgi:hypothetical protein